MAIDINFENHFRGVLMQADGALSASDLIGVMEQIGKLDSYGKVEYQILDLSNCFQVDVDVPSIRFLTHLSEGAASKSGGLKLAIVKKEALTEDFSTTLARFNRSQSLQIKICLDMATARSWISQADLEIMA